MELLTNEFGSLFGLPVPAEKDAYNKLFSEYIIKERIYKFFNDSQWDSKEESMDLAYHPLTWFFNEWNQLEEFRKEKPLTFLYDTWKWAVRNSDIKMSTELSTKTYFNHIWEWAADNYKDVSDIYNEDWTEPASEECFSLFG